MSCNVYGPDVSMQILMAVGRYCMLFLCYCDIFVWYVIK